MLMSGLNQTIDQLAMSNRVCCYGHVLRKEGGHALRRVLRLKVKVKLAPIIATTQ